MGEDHVTLALGYVNDTSKIIRARFHSTVDQKDLYGLELMDEDMADARTMKKLSWSMQTHMDEPNFDVCE